MASSWTEGLTVQLASLSGRLSSLVDAGLLRKSEVSRLSEEIAGLQSLLRQIESDPEDNNDERGRREG